MVNGCRLPAKEVGAAIIGKVKANSTSLKVVPPPPEFSAEEIDLLLQNINSYTPEEQGEILKIVEELDG